MVRARLQLSGYSPLLPRHHAQCRVPGRQRPLGAACRDIEARCAADDGPVGLPADWWALHTDAARTLELLLSRAR